MRQIAEISLCGLLHDLGKPILRYLIRVREGVEPENKDLIDKLDAISEGLIRKYLKGEDVKLTHDVIKIFINNVFERRFGLKCDEKIFATILSESDRIAAAERGLSEEYIFLRDIWRFVEKELNNILPEYTHHKSPMLSPLWILGLLDVHSYEKSLGPFKEIDRFNFLRALPELRNKLKNIYDMLDTKDVRKISGALVDTLSKFRNRKIWYPVKLITNKDLIDIGLYEYDVAKRISRYEDIVSYILYVIELLTYVYPSEGLDNGFVETFSEALRYSLLLVPSAIYIALSPDISLYSHSKLVSAYSVAGLLTSGLGRYYYRLLLVDARGIQDFIGSPVKAKAASRVIRGRSLLTELIIDAVIEYILKIFGDLPRTNVINDEGGSITILIPGYNDDVMRRKINLLREILSKYMRGIDLRFSLAYSDVFTSEDTEFLRGLAKGEGFLKIIKDLSEKIIVEKTKDDSKSIGLKIDHKKIIDYDSITQEIIAEEDLSQDGLGFVVDEKSFNYSSVISGRKLELGDKISSLTHLSLVAGNVARNMFAVLSIHIYKRSSDDIIEPAENETKDLVKNLCRCVSEKISEEKYDKALYYEYGKDRMGIIPLYGLGSVYILLSYGEREHLEPNGIVKNASNDIDMLYNSCLKDLLKNLSGKNLLVKIRIRLVNVSSEFINAFKEEKIKKLTNELIERGFDVSITTFFTGTYHPVKRDEILEKTVLKDLDEYDLIAMSKIDGDNIGEVKILLSLSPSRFITFSDLLTIFVVNKIHSAILSSGQKFEDVILLYAGGDDATIYGEWSSVLNFVKEVIYDKIIGSLYPLSFSVSIYIDRSDTPLLEIYRRTVDSLDSLKRIARGSVVIEPLSTPQIIEREIEKHIETKIVKAFPFVLSSSGWPLKTGVGSYISYDYIIDKLDQRYFDMLRDSKADLYILSRIANDAYRIIEKIIEAKKTLQEELELLSIENMFLYTCIRREENLKNIEKWLERKICYKPGEEKLDIIDMLKQLINMKTLIDLTILKLRGEREAVKR